MKQILMRKRNLLLFLIPLGIFCTQWAKRSADTAEYIFAVGIYKVLSQGISFLTGWLPFSLMELIAVTGPVLLIGLGIRQIVRFVKIGKEAEKKEVGEQRFLLLMTMVQNLLCLVSIIFFGYVLLCGVNYYRYPVAYHLGLEVKDSTVEELEGLLIKLADQATNLRTKLQTENEKSVYQLPYSIDELGRQAQKAYQQLAK